MRPPTEAERKWFCGKVGVHWHEDMPIEGKPDGAMLCRHCGQMFAGDHVRNPTFSDPREVLEVMMKRDNWDEFIIENGSVSKYGNHLDTILIDLITEPYALFWAAFKWMKKGE